MKNDVVKLETSSRRDFTLVGRAFELVGWGNLADCNQNDRAELFTKFEDRTNGVRHKATDLVSVESKLMSLDYKVGNRKSGVVRSRFALFAIGCLGNNRDNDDGRRVRRSARTGIIWAAVIAVFFILLFNQTLGYRIPRATSRNPSTSDSVVSQAHIKRTWPVATFQT